MVRRNNSVLHSPQLKPKEKFECVNMVLASQDRIRIGAFAVQKIHIFNVRNEKYFQPSRKNRCKTSFIHQITTLADAGIQWEIGRYKKHLAEQQHGFVRKKSVHSNLFLLVNTGWETLEGKLQLDTVYIYIDFSKAFDKRMQRVV